MVNKKYLSPGFNTYDLMLYAVGVAVILAGTSVLYNMYRSNSQINESAKGIAAIVGQVTGNFAGVSSYKALGTDGKKGNKIAVANGLIPENFIKSRGTSGDDELMNPWGGTITLKTKTSDTSVFDIELTEVPKNACNKLIAYDPSIWLDIEVSGTNAPGGSSKFEDGDPVSFAYENCGSKNKMTFTTR